MAMTNSIELAVLHQRSASAENPAYTEIDLRRAAGCGRAFPVSNFRINAGGETAEIEANAERSAALTFAGS